MVTILSVVAIVPECRFHDGDSELEVALEGRSTIGFAYGERFLFDDREVIFPAGVDVVPVVDVGSSTSVLAVESWRGGGVADELEDIWNIGDFGGKGGNCALGIFDAHNENGDVQLCDSFCFDGGLEEASKPNMAEEDFVANSLVAGGASGDSSGERDLRCSSIICKLG